MIWYLGTRVGEESAASIFGNKCKEAVWGKEHLAVKYGGPGRGL